MTLLVLTAALALSAGEKDIYLQALVPTSGGGADALLDGKPDTGWSPEGMARGEGVLFRFEEPFKAEGLEVKPCAGTKEPLDVYFDGRKAAVKAEKDGVGRAKPGFPFRSVFVKFAGGKGSACLAEVSFLGGAGRVRPPRGVHGKVTVSSVLTPEDAYHPGYLFDARTDFGWVEGSKGIGDGEWVTVTLDQPVTVTALELWNGYQRSADHFQKNCRAKKVSLSVDGGAAIPLDVKDVQGAQKLALPKPVKGTAFKLTIDQAVKGKKYTDLVLSELRLWDEAGPLQIVTDDVKERTQALKAELQGKPMVAVLDKVLNPVCAQGNEDWVKLRSNHTFAVYDSSEDGMVSVNEVVDGAWIVKAPAGIELFGRRQRISVDDSPYGSGTQESVRITGGPVTVSLVSELGKEGYAKLVEKWKKGPAARHVECDAAAKYDELAKAGAVAFEGTALTELVAP